MSIIINISIVTYLIVGSYCTMKHAYESEQGFKISLSQCLGSQAEKHWMNEQSYRLYVYIGPFIVRFTLQRVSYYYYYFCKNITVYSFKILWKKFVSYVAFKRFLLVNKEFVCCLNCVVNSSGIWVPSWYWNCKNVMYLPV